MPAANAAETNFGQLSGELNAIMHLVQESDMPPTVTAADAANDSMKKLADLMTKWSEVRATDVKALNEKLREAKLQELRLDGEPGKP